MEREDMLCEKETQEERLHNMERLSKIQKMRLKNMEQFSSLMTNINPPEKNVPKLRCVSCFQEGLMLPGSIDVGSW